MRFSSLYTQVTDKAAVPSTETDTEIDEILKDMDETDTDGSSDIDGDDSNDEDGDDSALSDTDDDIDSSEQDVSLRTILEQNVLDEDTLKNERENAADTVTVALEPKLSTEQANVENQPNGKQSSVVESATNPIEVIKIDKPFATDVKPLKDQSLAKVKEKDNSKKDQKEVGVNEDNSCCFFLMLCLIFLLRLPAKASKMLKKTLMSIS